jgi:HK97 family phage major capsid protein
MSTETKLTPETLAAVQEVREFWDAKFDAVSEGVDRLEVRFEKMGLDEGAPTAAKVATHDDLVRKGEGFATGAARLTGRTPAPRSEKASLGRTIAYMATGDQRHLTEAEQKGVVGNISPDGGWLLPDAIVGEMIDLARNKSRVFQAGARVLPMTERTVRLPRLENDAAAVWRGEGTLVAEEDIEFGHVTLSAGTLATRVLVSMEVMEDMSGPAYDLLSGALTNGVALGLDYAALRGSGVGVEPLGISADPLVPDDDISAVPADYDDIIDAITSIQGFNGEPTAAIYSARTAGTFAKLKTGLASDKTQLTMPREVAALQHLVSNQIPDNIGGAESEIIVGDWSKLVVGVRETVNVRVARMPKLDTMQYELLAYVRADVALLQPNHFYVVRGVQAA